MGVDHAGEHRDLSIEGITEGFGKGLEVLGEDCGPAAVGGCGEGSDLRGRDVRAVNDRAAWTARLERDKDEMGLKETQSHLVRAGLDPLRPEMVVIVVAAEAWDADADRILRAGDYAALALGAVLEAENKSCEHLGVHLGELHRPDFADLLARARRESAAVADLESRLERNRERPAGMVAGHVGLVDPSAGEIEARGDRVGVVGLGRLGVESALDRCRAAGLEALVGRALKLYVLDAALAADLRLERRAAVGVDHETVRLDQVQRRQKVDHSAALVDHGVLDVADRLDHKEALVLREHRLMMLVLKYRSVRSDADIQVAVLRRLAEKLHMPAVQQVVASGDKDFLGL